MPDAEGLTVAGEQRFFCHSFLYNSFYRNIHLLQTPLLFTGSYCSVLWLDVVYGIASVSMQVKLFFFIVLLYS